MYRRSSSNFYLEELRREAEEIRDLRNAESELKKKLIFEEKDIKIHQIYIYLMEKMIFFILSRLLLVLLV